MDRNELARYNFSTRLQTVLINYHPKYDTVEELAARFEGGKRDFDAQCEFLRQPGAGRATLNEFVAKVVDVDPLVARLRAALGEYAMKAGVDDIDTFVEAAHDMIINLAEDY